MAFNAIEINAMKQTLIDIQTMCVSHSAKITRIESQMSNIFSIEERVAGIISQINQLREDMASIQNRKSISGHLDEDRSMSREQDWQKHKDLPNVLMNQPKENQTIDSDNFNFRTNGQVLTSINPENNNVLIVESNHTNPSREPLEVISLSKTPDQGTSKQIKLALNPTTGDLEEPRVEAEDILNNNLLDQSRNVSLSKKELKFSSEFASKEYLHPPKYHTEVKGRRLQYSENVPSGNLGVVIENPTGGVFNLEELRNGKKFIIPPTSKILPLDLTSIDMNGESKGIIHNDPKSYKCKYCEKEYNEHSNLRRHEKKHEVRLQDENLQSSNIQKNIQVKLEINNTTLSSNYDPPNEQNPIPKETDSQTSSNVASFNRNKADPKEPISNPPIEKLVEDNPTFISNGKVLYKRPFTCKICQFRTQCKEDFEYHTNNSCKRKEPTCKICETKFPTAHLLKLHDDKEHRNPEIFSCDQCPYMTKVRSHVNKHIRYVHLKEADYQCDRCALKTTTKEKLAQHIKCVHEKVKDFQCQECAQFYSTKYNLDAHMKLVHWGLKMHSCEHCNYQSNRKAHVNYHLAKEHGINVPWPEPMPSPSKDETGNRTVEVEQQILPNDSGVRDEDAVTSHN